MTRAIVCAIIIVLTAVVSATAEESAPVAVFPNRQPENGNFNRPLPGQALEVSPPGFCWWRAGPRDEVLYHLRIHDEGGQAVYHSPLLRDPVDIPEHVLPNEFLQELCTSRIVYNKSRVPI